MKDGETKQLDLYDGRGGVIGLFCFFIFFFFFLL